jgi:enamine deaminase RidA (YjgF/YER057c/UK114 family)
MNSASQEKAMKHTVAAPEFAHYAKDWHLSPALDTGDFVFFSGETGCRPDATVSPDPEQQFCDAFMFLKANLAAAGLRFANVVEMTTYHVELRKHLSTFIRVKDEYVFAPYPAWTAIGVTELITEGTLLEIRIIARRPKESGFNP